MKFGAISAQILAKMLVNRHYASERELILDVADVFNAELRAGGRRRLPGDPGGGAAPPHRRRRRDAPPTQDLQFFTDAVNREIEGVETEIWLHTCWGNPNQQPLHWERPSYERALPYLLATDADVLTLECASTGGRDLPLLGKHRTDKKIAIGVVNHTTTAVEPPEVVAGLIRKALEYVPPERLILSTDCGFGREGLSRRIAFYKMRGHQPRARTSCAASSKLPEVPDPGRRSEVRMKRSTERFLTTHTGSLPRPDDLVRAMFAREEGVPVDGAALAARIRAGVADVVRKQAEAGVDVIDDGELSKPSYATYVKDRLAGFGGTSQPLQYQDLVEFPDLAKRVFGDPGRSRRRTPACNGPISVRDARAAETDAGNLKAALASVSAAEGFLTAASPGVISLFFRNDHYPSHEAYLSAIADAMRVEYEAVVGAGLLLQVDCPDLAMGRHIQYAGLDIEEFRRMARLHVEALNHALANVPPDRVRMHVCWGNYEGPHHYDVPLADIIDIVFLARPAGVSFEAANPRHAHEWRLFERVRVPEGKILIPGVLESKTNYIEHPELVAQRIGRYAKLVGRENIIAGTDCGYGTWVGQAAVDPGVVWAKLRSLAEGARLASREFWA